MWRKNRTPPPALAHIRQLLRPQQCRRVRSPRSFNPSKLLLHLQLSFYTYFAAPPVAAPVAAAVESTAAAAAGTATAANMPGTALAQQPVADSLAAASCEGIAITPPQYHTLQASGSSTIRYKQCHLTLFYHTPHYHIPYALLWVCGSAFTPHGLSQSIRGSCELHYTTRVTYTTCPPRDATPGDIFFLPKILSPGCVVSYAVYCTTAHIAETQKNDLQTQLCPATSIAQQRSAAPCGTVPFALGCGAVPCCAVLSFEHTEYQVSCEKHQVPGADICTCIDYKCFCFLLHSIVLTRSCFVLQVAPVLPITTWHRQQEHSTAQANQPCTSSSWHYQIASCIKSWASHFCPLHI